MGKIREVIAVLLLTVFGLSLLLYTPLGEDLPSSFVKVVAAGMILGGIVSLISLAVNKGSVIATIIHSGGLLLQLWVSVSFGLAYLLIFPSGSLVAVVIALLTLVHHGIQIRKLSALTKTVPLKLLISPLITATDELGLKLSKLTAKSRNLGSLTVDRQ